MANHAPDSSSQTVALTSVPIMVTSEGQLTHILDLGSLTSEGSVDLKPISESGDNSCGSNFSIMFQTSNGRSVDMLNNSLTDIKPAMTLLQPMEALSSVTSTTVSSVLSGTAPGYNTQAGSMQVSQDLHETIYQSQKMFVHNPTSSGDHFERTETGLSSVTTTYKTPQSLLSEDKHNSLESAKALIGKQCEDIQPASVCSTSIPLVLKQASESSSVTHSVSLSESVEGLETDSGAEKSMVSPAAFFTEGAVLVETPQGLMLSVGDELRAVTLTEGPDAEGNHLLSISNSGIPVALISECQHGGLIDEQAGGEVYEGGEGDIAMEDPVVSSTDLQGLTVSSPDDEEPRKKNRGWPKGKKRKIPAVVTGPRAPMTG